MAKRQKVELVPSLKAEDYKDGDTVISTGYIKSIENVKTKFDDEGTTSTILYIDDDAEKDISKRTKGIFMNTMSNNNLVDAFGEEDSIWLGKAVKVICNKQNSYNKKQLVIQAIK